MPVSDQELDQAVSDWKRYVTRHLREIDPLSLLKRKNLSMYMALGVTQPQDLADRLVNDHVASSVENTMGQLYELVLAQLGPVKVPKEQKKTPGYEGLDFVQETPTQIRLIDLASGSSTKNGGARTKGRLDMAEAAGHWEEAERKRTDDNPLAPKRKSIVRIWAVARGTPARTEPDEIVRLRGDAMWDYFGSGDGCLARIGAALARNPITGSEFQTAVDGVVQELIGFLSGEGFVQTDGSLEWPSLLAAFP